MFMPYNGSMAEPIEVTRKMAAILKVFLESPEEPHYGMEIMRVTGLSSGSVYPVLARLRKKRWLTAGTEDIDPHTEGRPARRFYKITADAVPVARVQLAALSDFYRPPTMRPRLTTEGGGLR
jgi:PadR family transcriptional regulator, regulatory protein PadR